MNSATQGGDTPLHWAVTERQTAVVRLLLQHNADVTVANQRGDTAASLSKGAGGEIGQLVEAREAQQRQQQQQRQVESSTYTPAFAVTSAAAERGGGGAPKKKMTIKLKPKK